METRAEEALRPLTTLGIRFSSRILSLCKKYVSNNSELGVIREKTENSNLRYRVVSSPGSPIRCDFRVTIGNLNTGGSYCSCSGPRWQPRRYYDSRPGPDSDPCIHVIRILSEPENAHVLLPIILEEKYRKENGFWGLG